MRTRHLAALPALLAVSALALAACGENRQTVRIDGSSTVFPISEAAAEEYSKLTRARINVGFSGTGAGFEKFCRGDTHISDASRPITESEIGACAENGIDDIVELQVAIDALTVVVNPNNSFVDCLSVQQLHDLFSGEATRWSDIDPAWPDARASFFYPGTDSGTFDYFLEAIIEDVDEDAFHTADGTPSEDDNVLALGIRNEENAIGYFGFAYFLEAGQALKAIPIDDGAGCVEPTFQNALDGTYSPLSRPLFIYTRESFLAEHPDSPVLSFIQFYLDNTDALVQEVGYVTMPADVLGEQYSKIEPFLAENQGQDP
jgi:phosphate transport system substrate-binding protein